MAKARGKRGGAARHFNPGMMTAQSGARRGLAAVQPKDGPLAFRSPTLGIRAMADRLLGIQEDGARTLTEILARWAAMSEAPTPEPAAIARAMGIGPDEPVELTRHASLRALVEALIRHAQGELAYTESQIVKGLVMAGIEPELRPLDQSRTMRGGVLGTVLMGLAGLIDAVRADPDRAQMMVRDLVPAGERWLLEALPHLAGAQNATQVFLLVALGYMLWARLDDRRKGLR